MPLRFSLLHSSFSESPPFAKVTGSLPVPKPSGHLVVFIHSFVCTYYMLSTVPALRIDQYAKQSSRPPGVHTAQLWAQLAPSRMRAEPGRVEDLWTRDQGLPRSWSPRSCLGRSAHWGFPIRRDMPNCEPRCSAEDWRGAKSLVVKSPLQCLRRGMERAWNKTAVVVTDANTQEGDSKVLWLHGFASQRGREVDPRAQPRTAASPLSFLLTPLCMLSAPLWTHCPSPRSLPVESLLAAALINPGLIN